MHKPQWYIWLTVSLWKVRYITRLRLDESRTRRVKLVFFFCHPCTSHSREYMQELHLQPMLLLRIGYTVYVFLSTHWQKVKRRRQKKCCTECLFMSQIVAFVPSRQEKWTSLVSSVTDYHWNFIWLYLICYCSVLQYLEVVMRCGYYCYFFFALVDTDAVLMCGFYGLLTACWK